MGFKNIRENQWKMSIISLKISGKIREYFPEIVVATLTLCRTNARGTPVALEVQ